MTFEKEGLPCKRVIDLIEVFSVYISVEKGTKINYTLNNLACNYFLSIIYNE